MNDTTNNTTIAPPSTPSWMTDQRNKRRNNRGYGRRSSFGGRSTPGLRRSGSMPLSSTDNAHRESAALFAGTPSALDFDGEDHDVLDNNGTGEGGGEGISVGDRNNGRRLVRRSTYTDGETTPTPDQGQGSAHSSRPPRSATSGTGSEYSKQSSKRMKRPNNIPRPPRSRGGSSKASSASTRSQLSTPKVDDYLKDFEFGSEETLTSASSASSASESRDTPMKGVGVNGGGRKRNATKRPKVMSTPRSSNNTASSDMLPPRAIAAEENFTPANLNSNNVSSSTPIRKSSRLEQKARLATNNSSSTSSLSSSMVNNANNNTNNEITTTRSRVTRATSKKHSALERSMPEGGTKSESNFEQHSSSSFGNFPSRSNSSSNSNILTQNNNSRSGSESFSSLAQRDTSWANTTTGGATTTKLKGCDHKRSMSVASISSTNNGGGLLRSHSISNELKTPSTIHSRSISCGGNLSSWNINNLSPERCLGTNQSTPSTGASSSRKRRTMDDSSPILNDNDLLDGSERSRLRRTPPDELLGGSGRSRSRNMPPPPPPTQPFILEDAINELNYPPSNEPIQQPQQQQMMNPFPLPPTSATFGASLMNDDVMSLVGNDDFDLDNSKKPGMRDRLSSETEDMNDESMTMNESDNDNDNNSTTSTSSEESEDDNKTPRELTNVEIFDTKSSYDDFKFLTKSLQTWSKKSLNGKGASMGLNNGCLIAVPADWTFEHRGSFAKWVATAFPSFRVGSVGGAGGSFLKCSDAEGKKALMKLVRILNDYKSGRLENVKAGSSDANKAKPAAR